MSYFIGVDIGTTSTKAIVFSEAGEMKGMGNVGYSLFVPQAGWAEQDPEQVFQAVIAAMRSAIDQCGVPASQIAAVSFSGAMHSLIAMDGRGQPLTRAIIWADNRSIPQAKWLNQNGGRQLYRQTGTPIHPMSPLPKLMWLRQEEPETFQRAARFVSIKEYVLYRLSDRCVVDYSIASTTGLLNLATLQWHEVALSLAGIRPEHLGELVPTTFILKGIRSEYASAIGLDSHTPLVVGATDGVLANLGIGAIAPRQFGITIGTSGAVRSVVPKPLTDPQGRTFCYALTPDHWVIGGSSNNGGIVLRWLRDTLCQPEVDQARQQGINPYDLMVQLALEVPPGAEGLLCLPFLSGERAPYWDANARGVFFGLGLHHRKAHLIRAGMEGILFAIYSITRALQDLIGTAVEIRASGGFARSKPWRQMMADVLGYEVLIPQMYESSAFGAAVLGMLAVGAMSQLEAVTTLIQLGDRHLPNPQSTDTYQKLFTIYEQLYPNVREQFEALARLSTQGDKHF